MSRQGTRAFRVTAVILSSVGDSSYEQATEVATEQK